MNMYVNLCTQYTNKSDTLTVDLPPEYSDEFMQMVHVLADERNISARRAFVDMVRYTYYNLLEGTNDKNRKNAKRGRRSSGR
mgnify:FL=1|jgi:hypothetical protein